MTDFAIRYRSLAVLLEIAEDGNHSALERIQAADLILGDEQEHRRIDTEQEAAKRVAQMEDAVDELREVLANVDENKGAR